MKTHEFITTTSEKVIPYSIEIPDSIYSQLYQWVDLLTLSREKDHIERDFSDGVLLAEVLKQTLVDVKVDLMNYPSALSKEKKVENYTTLNRKIYLKLQPHYCIGAKDIAFAVASEKGSAERNLLFTCLCLYEHNKWVIERLKDKKEKMLSEEDTEGYDRKIIRIDNSVKILEKAQSDLRFVEDLKEIIPPLPSAVPRVTVTAASMSPENSTQQLSTDKSLRRVLSETSSGRSSPSTVSYRLTGGRPGDGPIGAQSPILTPVASTSSLPSSSYSRSHLQPQSGDETIIKDIMGSVDADLLREKEDRIMQLERENEELREKQEKYKHLIAMKNERIIKCVAHLKRYEALARDRQFGEEQEKKWESIRSSELHE
ncbi:hypothetical protein ADUPG1_014867 [Aduncisulcus paluster]|uniref:CH-like domain-containing protein n=11 Tax=Aduncisulcus paluster TaxID=2918883 RepID=A0ABQ5KBG6_9EUKA|nr:hypothetical protein ADUPG1_014867 [Aduncisulcus paluster]